MNTNGTPLKTNFFFLVAFLLSSVSGFCQPDYVFRSSVLISGTDGEVGSVYRFPSVKPGVDAFVTVSFISPGISIETFDDNANGGFDEAFQPRLTASAFTKGYAEFNFEFVLAGTNIPLVMLQVPATSIDVDGGGAKDTGLHEYDEYITPGMYWVDYDMIGTDLEIIFGATSVVGRNILGVEKTLIDTMAKEAMFTVNYAAVSHFTARIGLENHNGGSTTRQRSVYFARFFYANSFLPVNNLVSFSGNRPKNNQVVLNWSMNKQHQFMSTTIEKSSNGNSFAPIGQIAVQGKTTSAFIDNSTETGSSFYRLKMTEHSGKVTYSSVVYIKSGNASGKINVFPSIVAADYTNINYSTDRSGTAKIAVYDQSGRMVHTQDIRVSAGSNTFAVTGLSRFNRGQYIVTVSGQDFRYAQQIQIAH